MSFLCMTRNKEVSYHQCINECQYFFKSACIDKMNEAYNQALEDMANRIKEYSGEHYIDCDGYFGRQTELVFRTEEFLDDVLSELKK